MGGVDSEEPVGPGWSASSRWRRTAEGRGSEAGRFTTAGTRGANIRGPTARSPPVRVAPETATKNGGRENRRSRRRLRTEQGTPRSCWIQQSRRRRGPAGRLAAERHGPGGRSRTCAERDVLPRGAGLQRRERPPAQSRLHGDAPLRQVGKEHRASAPPCPSDEQSARAHDTRRGLVI